MPKGPAKSTQLKGGRYYYIRAEGRKRIWVPLTRKSEGLPAFYKALSLAMHRDALPDSMLALVEAWRRDVMTRHSAKTQVDEKRRADQIAESFKEFRADEVEPPDCLEFLAPLRVTGRTHDLMRSQLHSIFQHAEVLGMRKAGSNPVTPIKPIGYKPRQRYITDSEMRRIKIGCVYGSDGKRNRSGITTACCIELAYLTGMDVGVMIRILEEKDQDQPEEPHITSEGIWLRRDKTKQKGGDALIITWTPRLLAVVRRLQLLKKERMLKTRASQRIVTSALITKQDGTPMTYEALSNAWLRAVKRSGVKPAMFRDLRAKALTDKAAREGVRAASDLGVHATESQTTAYVRRNKARKTGAAA